MIAADRKMVAQALNERARFATALGQYLKAVGDEVMHPECYAPGSVLRNGTTVLRNRNGVLAYVTARGKVFDRIGGNRLDDGVQAPVTKAIGRLAKSIRRNIRAAAALQKAYATARTEGGAP
jgi:hypothetical protein